MSDSKRGGWETQRPKAQRQSHCVTTHGKPHNTTFTSHHNTSSQAPFLNHLTPQHRPTLPTQLNLPKPHSRHPLPSHTTPSQSTTTMGCAQSRPSATYYDEYFKSVKAPQTRHRSHRIVNVDRYKPGPEYREHRQWYEQNVMADRYQDAYDQLTARSKFSRAHGLQEYYEDRGWS